MINDSFNLRWCRLHRLPRRRLVEKGYDVAVVDNLVTGHRAAVNAKALFYEGDVRDQAFLDGVFDKEDIEGVIHFAAFSVVPESMKKPLKYFDNNTAGMVSLLEVMNKHNVKKIVFSSTPQYGEPKRFNQGNGSQSQPILMVKAS